MNNHMIKNKIPSFKGFTLIEILVVMAIIAIILSFVTLSMGNSLAREMEREAQKLTYILKLAYQESVMKSQEIGVFFKQNSYEFYRLHDDKWQAIHNDAVFRSHTVNPTIQMTLFISGQKVDINKTTDFPQLLILSSGELSSFEILWTSDIDARLHYRITGTIVGKITLNQ
jgi:general secretion pathway protein H